MTAPSDYDAIIERIQSARSALHADTDLDTRIGLLDELGAATRDLAELIVQQKGRLRSPME